MLPSDAIRTRGRLKAALLWSGLLALFLLQAGCSSTGNTLSSRTLQALWPEEDTRTQASSIPYASLDMTVEGSGGLFILATQRGETTYWQSQDATFALQHGYLARTAGAVDDLVDTRLQALPAGDSALPWQPAATPQRYRVTRAWRSVEGTLVRQQAEAVLRCKAQPQALSLPLQTRQLQQCEETLHWPGQHTTQGTLWRSPEDGRIWAMTTQAWPDGPVFTWQVARPWW